MNNITELIRLTLEKVKEKMQERILLEQRSASGRSAASLSVKADGLSGSILGNPSLLTIECGRGQGRVPSNFVDIIKEWILAKGISVKPIATTRQTKITPKERGLDSLAGAIAYTIMKKGTKLHRDGRTNDIYSTALNEALNELGKEITFGLAEQITTINNQLQ